MTEISPASPLPEPEINAEELCDRFVKKQGTWIEWGEPASSYRKQAILPQGIFEETGFEPIQQNQIIVAAQVYTSLVNGNASANVLAHFQQKGSDSLYELRVLAQSERAAAAELP